MTDNNRFDALVRNHTAAVSTYARAISSDQWIAEEAAHETFVRAWQYLDSFRGEGSFEGWLLRICRNCVTDIAARRWKETPLETIPDEGVIDADTLAVDELLSTLPLPQREVVTLCGVLGYDYQAAADILGIPIGTVRSRLSRARTNLAKDLGGLRQIA